MDIMIREDIYNHENEQDRQWFRDATRFAVSRQKLREKDKRHIEEACLYEIVCKTYPKDESKIAEFVYPPADALSDIYLLDYESESPASL